MHFLLVMFYYMLFSVFILVTRDSSVRQLAFLLDSSFRYRNQNKGVGQHRCTRGRNSSKIDYIR
jgi:hypothetical protein